MINFESHLNILGVISNNLPKESIYCFLNKLIVFSFRWDIIALLTVFPKY